MITGDIKLQCGITARYKGEDDFSRPLFQVVDGDLEFTMVCTSFDGRNLTSVSPSGEPCVPVEQRYKMFYLSESLEQFASDLYDLQIAMALSGEWEASHYPVDLTHLFDEYRSRKSTSALLIYRAGVMLNAWSESS